MAFGSVKMTHVDGTMHHLGVNETMIAKDIILVPDPMSVAFYAQFLDDAKQMGDYREYVTYTGSFNGKPLTVMSSGFGCMPMAIAIEELNHLHAERVIKLEACPAIQPDLPCGTVCLCKGAVRGEGASREYIDPSYPAIPDMELLSKLARACGKDAQLSVFRSHDCANHESPFAPGGMERVRNWAALGVDILDGGTSAMYVVGSILKVKTASAAVVNENYETGEQLSLEQTQDEIKKLFLAAADALTL